jgi:hypothetical protein
LLVSPIKCGAPANRFAEILPKAEFKRYLLMAIGSADEMQV